MFTVSFCSRHAFAKVIGCLFGVGVSSFLLSTLGDSTPILSFLFLLGMIVLIVLGNCYYKLWKMTRYIVSNIRRVMEIEDCSLEDAFEYLSNQKDRE